MGLAKRPLTQFQFAARLSLPSPSRGEGAKIAALRADQRDCSQTQKRRQCAGEGHASGWGWVRAMRTGGLVVLCAALAGVLGGCAVLGHDAPPRTISPPPAETALYKSLVVVAQTAKWPGVVEASPVRQAHLISPA